MVLNRFPLLLSAQLVIVTLFCSSCVAPKNSQRMMAADVSAHASAPQPEGQLYPSPANPLTSAQARNPYGALPMSFEPNRGQTDAQVKFLSRGQGYSLFLAATEAVLTVDKPQKTGETTHPPLQTSLPPAPSVVRMQLLGANPTPQVTGMRELRGKVNYLIGRDPTQWQTNIPTYRQVRYQAVYPGVDLIYYGNQRQLEYDFVVAPGVDPTTIRFALTDQAGQLLPQTIDANGNLVLQTTVGELRFHKPFVYQEEQGVKKQVEGQYVFLPQGSPGTLTSPSHVGFHVAAYDTTKPLVIDPVLMIVYSTFLGGDRGDAAFAMTLDADHNVYLAGQTLSANFPITASVIDTTADMNNGDAFVAKLNDTGTELLYATYLGGPGADVAKAIAVDSEGNAYITGETLAPDKLNPVFPTTDGVVQPTAGGGLSDAFVAKLNATGSELLYSTYLGGEAYDRGNGIALDADGNAYIAGQTLSDFFLLKSGTETVFGNGPLAPNNSAALPHDAFVVKLNPTGTAREYTAVFSARAFEDATAIAVNADGEAYVVGRTTSLDFPLTPNALRGKGGVDGTSDAFVTKLNVTGTRLLYSTFLGGIGDIILDPSGEVASAVAIDSAGNAVVTGITRAPDFPTTKGAIAGERRGEQDGFLSILDVNAPIPVTDEDRKPLYSTYLGGNNVLQVNGLAVLGSGQRRLVFLSGTTQSGFPTSLCAAQSLYGGGPSDAFIDKLGIDLVEPDNSGVAYASYLGGSEKDEAYAFAVDGDLNMYVAGLTQSSSFRTTSGTVQPNFGGTQDAFVTKFDTLSHGPCADLRLTMTDEPDPIAAGGTVTYSLTVTNLGPDIAANVTVTDILPNGVTLLSATPSTGACVGTTTLTCSMGTLTVSQTATITIVARVAASGVAINRASVTASGPDLEDNNNTIAVNTSVVGGSPLTISLKNETGANGQIISRPPGIACPPDCSETYPPGATVTLIAQPDEQTSFFQSWDGACSQAKTEPLCLLTVNGDQLVGASFARSAGLSAQWLDLSQTCRLRGKQQTPRCRVTGTLKVSNLGTVRAGKSLTRFFFSEEPTLNSGYTVLKTKKTPALDGGGAQVIHVDLKLPSGVNGKGKFVVAQVDADAQVPEANERDNRAAFGPLP